MFFLYIFMRFDHISTISKNTHMNFYTEAFGILHHSSIYGWFCCCFARPPTFFIVKNTFSIKFFYRYLNGKNYDKWLLFVVWL